VTSFSRPPSNGSLWGSKGVQPHDIIQGDVGDCYFLSASAALAEHPKRIEKLFLTKSLNREGIVAVKIFIKGRPEIVTIDTAVPYKSGSKLMFAD